MWMVDLRCETVRPCRDTYRRTRKLAVGCRLSAAVAVAVVSCQLLWATQAVGSGSGRGREQRGHRPQHSSCTGASDL